MVQNASPVCPACIFTADWCPQVSEVQDRDMALLKVWFRIDLGKLASVTALVTIVSQSLWFQPIFLILPMAHLLPLVSSHWLLVIIG